jgi:hypothetical protein
MLAQLYKEQQRTLNAEYQGGATHGRSRTLSNNPFADIRARLLKEMMDMEQVRLATLNNPSGEWAGLELEDVLSPPSKEPQPLVGIVDQEDPSGSFDFNNSSIRFSRTLENQERKNKESFTLWKTPQLEINFCYCKNRSGSSSRTNSITTYC